MVLCSDGVIEATNELGEQFGYDRTAATIRDAGISKLSAHGLMQRLFDDVAAFVGAEVQEDDQTVVVVKALDLTTQICTVFGESISYFFPRRKYS